jgi:HAD superfamily hydrolase (TIGR01509 family)
MRGSIELVLFDLGDTLVYENGPWDVLFRQADAALWKVLHEAGVTLRPRDVYGDSTTLFDLYYDLHRNDLNEPTSAAVLDGVLRLNGFEIDKETLRAGMRAMFSVTQTNWLPEADAIPTLEAVKRGGLHIGLISNASDDGNTQALIDKAGVRPYLEFILSSAAYGKRKPHPSIFHAALENFGIPPERAVMVGDNYEADILGAQGVGMQAIWNTRRVPEPQPGVDKAKAEAVVGALSEVPRLLGVA